MAIASSVFTVAIVAAPPVRGDTPTAQATAPVNGVFSLTAPQAREIAVVLSFIDAYNAGDLDAALAPLTDDAQLADCHYRDGPAGREVQIQGKTQIAAWLRVQFADHDRIEVTRIFDENPAQPVGVVGVEFGRRTIDSLLRIGLPDGVVPAGAKVVFTATHDGIAFFVAGCP